jgi:hypothetical protein
VLVKSRADERGARVPARFGPAHLFLSRIGALVPDLWRRVGSFVQRLPMVWSKNPSHGQLCRAGLVPTL